MAIRGDPTLPLVLFIGGLVCSCSPCLPTAPCLLQAPLPPVLSWRLTLTGSGPVPCPQPQPPGSRCPSLSERLCPALCQQTEGLAPQLPPEPQQPPDEDEDQWEDVSEEDDDEGHLSSLGEEEEVPPVGAPKAPRAPKVGRGPAPKLDMPPPGAHGGQGKALSPFSPAEGYQPVSDWGEEMELNSPRGSVGDSTPQGPGPAPQAQGAGPPGEAAGKRHWLGPAGGRGGEPVYWGAHIGLVWLGAFAL